MQRSEVTNRIGLFQEMLVAINFCFAPMIQPSIGLVQSQKMKKLRMTYFHFPEKELT